MESWIEFRVIQVCVISHPAKVLRTQGTLPKWWILAAFFFQYKKTTTSAITSDKVYPDAEFAKKLM